MFERLLAAVTTMTIAATGATAAQSRYDWLVQLMPMLIGVLMVILTRSIIDMNASKKRAWNYNMLVLCLCSVFTAVFVHEWALTAGQATLFGMGCGAMGVGIISFGKPVLLAVISKVSDGLKTPPAL